MEKVMAFDLPADPRMERADQPYGICANCGASSAGIYCAQCGQKHRTPRDLRLSKFFRHVIEEFTSVDSKIFRSLTSLLFAPGKLTAQWMAGRERSYVKPVQLFLVVNLCYFLFQHFVPFNTFTAPLYVQHDMQMYSPLIRPIIDQQVRDSHLTFAQFSASYNDASAGQARSMIILMVPMFAGILALLCIRKRRYFVEHLIFSLHFYAFFLILESIGIVIMELLMSVLGMLFHFRVSNLNWDETVTLLAGVVIFAYLLLALHRSYGSGWAMSGIKAFVLTNAVLYIIFAYRFILFFTTIYTMRAHI